MILFKKAADLIAYLALKKSQGSRVGFVPTMGALHPGHISLVEISKKENELTGSSIFVNPTQFNVASDFNKYPVTIEKDIDALEQAGTDYLFMPSVAEVYPFGLEQLQQYDLGYLETVLEGSSRPGHFQGVCQVVHRLLDITRPEKLYLGRKDYQQCMVIKRLVEITGLNTDVVICPTLRERDGLAMSSRNMRLSDTERLKAVKIHESLKMIEAGLRPGDIEPLKGKAKRFLSDAGFRVDYVEVADANNLQIISEWDGKRPLVALAAAFLNEVRLIDNLLLNE